MYVCVGTHPTAHMWKSVDNLRESVFYFYCMTPRNRTHIIRFCSSHLYQLSHLANTTLNFLMSLLLFILNTILHQNN